MKIDARILRILYAGLALAIAVGSYVFLPADLSEPARRMFAIFVIAALFWALEIVPLYTTSIIIVILEVLLLCRPGGVMNMDAGGYKVFLLPFGSPIVMLFFGGLTMAAAMQKYELDKIIARKLLNMFGTSPFFIMVGFMVTAAFLSMWMSNTATTAMMIAMVLPLIRQIKPDDPFRTGLLLSIPFAANIGGLATPVGTPPNAIAIGILFNEGIALSFTSWMMMALPLALILLAGTAVLLYALYKPQARSLNLKLDSAGPVGRKALLVGVITCVTIIMWLTSSWHKIPSAVVALLAVGGFYSCGLLGKTELKSIDWDVLVLMWGGLALGEGLVLTGLTDWIVNLPFFDREGMVLVGVFCALAIILSTFMSNTATANLLIPIVMVIPGENNLLLAITVALSCSFAMALPISTPPNAIAYASGYIGVKDMMKSGVVISVLALITLLMGYSVIIPAIFGG